MLAEATQSARVVAEQFAKDSHTHLGSIRRANQGQFQLNSRDGNANEAGSVDKKIRLVSSIDYYLKD
jgi:hypothetical protein